MKTILGTVAIAMLGVAAVLYTATVVLFQMLPTMIVTAAVGALCYSVASRSRRPTSARPPTPRAAFPPPGSATVGRAQFNPPRGQWVLLPVWVPPAARPPRPYVDAEVIEDDSGA